MIAVYDAVQRRDWPTLQRQVAPIAVLRIGGRNRYAGMGDEVRALVRVYIRMSSTEVFEARLRETFSFDEEGRVSELVVRGEDQRTLDEFLG